MSERETMLSLPFLYLFLVFLTYCALKSAGQTVCSHSHWMAGREVANTRGREKCSMWYFPFDEKFFHNAAKRLKKNSSQHTNNEEM